MTVCPLMRMANLMAGGGFKSESECLGERCELFVKIWKPSVDATIRQTFEGCGLINTIPWAIKERCVGEKPKSVLSNQASEPPNFKKQSFSPFPKTGSKPTPRATSKGFDKAKKKKGVKTCK